MSLLLFYDHNNKIILKKLMNIEMEKFKNIQAYIDILTQKIDPNISHDMILEIETDLGEWNYILNPKSDIILCLFNYNNILKPNKFELLLLNINKHYSDFNNYNKINELFININKFSKIEYILKKYFIKYINDFKIQSKKIEKLYPDLKINNFENEIQKLSIINERKRIEEQEKIKKELKKKHKKKIFFISILVFSIILIVILWYFTINLNFN